MSKLADEVQNDPLTLGYSGMTDQELVDSLNGLTRTSEHTTMTAGQVMESIDGPEFTALTDADKARVDRVLSLGAEVIIGPGNSHNAVTELVGAFGAGSTTISNLASKRTIATSRATELGLGTISLKTLKLESIR